MRTMYSLAVEKNIPKYLILTNQFFPLMTPSSFASCTKNVAHHQKNITDPHLRDASNIKRILVN